MDISSDTFKRAVADACRAGIESEQVRAAQIVQSFQCFDHHVSGCDHAECYSMDAVLAKLVTVQTCSTCSGDGLIDEGDVNGVVSMSTCSECVN